MGKCLFIPQANLFFSCDMYKRKEDLADGKFFYALLYAS